MPANRWLPETRFPRDWDGDLALKARPALIALHRNGRNTQVEREFINQRDSDKVLRHYHFATGCPDPSAWNIAGAAWIAGPGTGMAHDREHYTAAVERVAGQMDRVSIRDDGRAG